MSFVSIDVEPDNTDLWADQDLANRVLENMQQMHPQYLAMLLDGGELAQTVRRRIDWYKRTMERLQRALPNEPYENLGERARDCLGGLNVNRQKETPLTKHEMNLLAEFREKHRI
jgi:hypothetical protein